MASKNPKIEGPASTQPLGRGPGSMTREGHSSGQVQQVGTTVNLNRTPVGIAPGKTNPVKVEGPATSCSLNRTPVKGFLGNGDIPMSARAIAQSDMVKGKGKKAGRS